MNHLEKFSLEFVINASPKLLFTLISTPEGLTRWFADAVFAQEDVFIFIWEGSEQKARLVDTKDQEYVKFEWLDDFHQGYVLEMHILTEALSTGVSLQVTDYSEPSDMDFSHRLWTTQVKQLQRLFNA